MIKNYLKALKAIKEFKFGGILFAKEGYVLKYKGLNKRFNTRLEAIDWARAKGMSGREVAANLSTWKLHKASLPSKALVLRADRSAEGTAKATNIGKQMSKYGTFKLAYNSAIGRGDMYFDYKGKVYTLDADDLAGIKKAGRKLNDNRADMLARYGKYMGWSKDPNMGASSVLHTTDVKNDAIGNLTIEEAIANNPAEPTQYNPGYLRGHVWGELNPDDVANMWYGIGAGAAGATMAPMVMMEAAPTTLYNIGLGVLSAADGISWAGKEAVKGAKDAVSGLRQGNLMGNGKISLGTGNYAHLGMEFLNDFSRMGSRMKYNYPTITPRPSGPIIPSNPASLIASYGERLGWLTDGTGNGIIGSGMLLVP